MLVALGRLDAPTDIELQELRINVQLSRTYSTHQFTPYDGPVILFKTESHMFDAHTLSFGWGETLSPDTPVYPLQGWHEDTLLWHGFDRIVDVIEARLHRTGQGAEPATRPTAIAES